MPVPAPDPAALRWAVNAAAPGADVTEVRGLRDGGSPWLVRLSRGGRLRSVVLRVATMTPPPFAPRWQPSSSPRSTTSRPPACSPPSWMVRCPGVPLVEQLPGSSAIPTRPPLGPPPHPGPHRRHPPRPSVWSPVRRLPRRDRPIGSVDFAALRRQHPPNPRLIEAEQRVSEALPHLGPGAFVHGDLWQGNALWAGDTLTGLWTAPAPALPVSTSAPSRCDAAICFGPEAAHDIQRRLGGGRRPNRHRASPTGTSSPP